MGSERAPCFILQVGVFYKGVMSRELWILIAFFYILQNQLFEKINVPEDRILAIDPSLPVQECADDYAGKLSKVRFQFIDKLNSTNLIFFFNSYLLIEFCHFRPLAQSKFQFLTCCCWEWDQMDTPALSFLIILYYRFLINS